MPFKSGTTKRLHPRVEVLRGYDPQKPTTLTHRAPVADGVSIKSGQIISLSVVSGKLVWNLGKAAGAVPYVALQDSDDADVDGGTLTGLSCSGQFEFQTGYFGGDNGDWIAGQPVSAHATNGTIVAGATAKAGSNQPRIGTVSRLVAGPINVITLKQDSSATDGAVVSFVSHYVGDANLSL